MSDLYKKVADGWPVIAAAPETFAAIMIAFIVVAVPSIWLVLNWSYRTRIENFQARLGSKDEQIASLQRQRDEYKNKLSGASPDEAKARIEALERRLIQVEPRRLAAEQREIIVRVLRSALGEAHTVQVAYDAACADCNGYAAEVGAAIGAAPGWTPINAMVMGPRMQSAKGLAVLVPDLNNPGQTASLLMRAFSEAGVAFEALRTPWGADVAAASVLVSARIA
jgi:hypothetical protein